MPDPPVVSAIRMAVFTVKGGLQYPSTRSTRERETQILAPPEKRPTTSHTSDYIEHISQTLLFQNYGLDLLQGRSKLP